MNFINGQYVYPMWIVLDIDIGLTSVKIKAYQLHHLSPDSSVGDFAFDGNFDTPIYGITQEFSSSTFLGGEPIPIANYNPYATDNILLDGSDANGNAVSYMSLSYSTPSPLEVVVITAFLLGDENPTHFDFDLSDEEAVAERFKYDANGNIKPPDGRGIVGIDTIIDIIEIILGD